jgi:hypothetical protein
VTRRSAIVTLLYARPHRTLALSVVPLVLAVVQSANVVLFDMPAAYGVAFAVGMVACSVGLTRQQLASFRTESLEDDLFD